MSERPTEALPTRLVAATPAHFSWLCGEGEALDGLSLPAPLEPPEVLWWLERKAREAEEAGARPGAWLVACQDEVVGLISFKGAPADGLVEVGYGIAAAHRLRGHASRALGLVVAHAGALGLGLFAEARADNDASLAVLRRNGFVVTGERVDPDDGLILKLQRVR